MKRKGRQKKNLGEMIRHDMTYLKLTFGVELSQKSISLYEF